jgi:hypothetical protein
LPRACASSSSRTTSGSASSARASPTLPSSMAVRIVAHLFACYSLRDQCLAPVGIAG